MIIPPKMEIKIHFTLENPLLFLILCTNPLFLIPPLLFIVAEIIPSSPVICEYLPFAQPPLASLNGHGAFDPSVCPDMFSNKLHWLIVERNPQAPPYHHQKETPTETTASSSVPRNKNGKYSKKYSQSSLSLYR